MSLLIFKALNNLAPNYICSKINMARNSHSHNTRGAAKNLTLFKVRCVSCAWYRISLFIPEFLKKCKLSVIRNVFLIVGESSPKA